MDRKPILDRSMFSGAPGVVRVLRHPRGPRLVSERREPLGGGADRGLVLLGTLLDVGLDIELSAGAEEPPHLAEEEVAHHEALLVTFLPPRVREMEERPGEHAVRTEATERVLRVFGEDPGPRTEPCLREARVDDLGPLPADLEPDQAGGGRRRGAFEEEASSPGTHFDLEFLASDEGARVDGLPLGEARSVVVGSRGGHGGACTVH